MQASPRPALRACVNPPPLLLRLYIIIFSFISMSLKSYKTIFEKQEKKASHHSPGWNRGPGSVRGRHDILRVGSGYLSGS